MLGSLLLAEWDARVGIGSNTWTDLIGGRVATGSGTPTLAPVTGKFNGQPVWNFVAASSQKLDTGNLGANIFTTGGAGFYMSFVAQASDTDLVDGRYIEVTNGVATEVAAFRSSASGWLARFCGADVIPAGSTIDLNVNLWEIAFNGGTRQMWKNGTSLGTNGAATVNANVDRVCFGGFPSGVAFADCRVARMRLCSALPSQTQRDVLRRVDKAIWGTT